MWPVMMENKCTKLQFIVVLTTTCRKWLV